jgi:hypothetical protein
VNSLKDQSLVSNSDIASKLDKSSPSDEKTSQRSPFFTVKILSEYAY